MITGNPGIPKLAQGLLMLLAVVAVAVAGVLLCNESLTRMKVIGILLTVGGAILINLR
jgi:multidrug transporter EmrE-like cation transporter